MNTAHERNDQVNVVVTEDQKARWEAYLDQHGAEFQSLSQLIRQSVEREVRDETDDAPETHAPAHDTSEVLEAIGRLDEHLQEMETRLSSIEQQVRDDPAVREVANEVFEQLPTKETLLDYEQSVAEAGAQPPNEVLPRSNSGAIEDLASVLEEPQHRVREALQRLQQDTHQVHTLSRDGDTRYYKEG